jgi:hypothetical protein
MGGGRMKYDREVSCFSYEHEVRRGSSFDGA